MYDSYLYLFQCLAMKGAVGTRACPSSGLVGSLSSWLVPISNPTVAKFLSVTLEDAHIPFTSLKWTESTSVARMVHVIQNVT